MKKYNERRFPKLRKRMRDMHITQKDLAESLCITYDMVSARMTGRTPFRYNEVAVICDRLCIENPRQYFEEHGT